jgi:uncharacterized membrane protein SpoIIM required for sporulation
MRAVVQTYCDLIRGAKKWLAVTSGMFCLAFAAALVVGFAKPGLIQDMVDRLPESNETGFADFIAIARNNVTVMLISWDGSLVLAIGPVWNTLHMGFIGGGFLLEGPITFWLVAILPHGIIELPAMLLSNAFFLKFGLRWAFQKSGTARKRAVVADFRDSLKIALLCAVLFCVAASIEAFATPLFLDAYAKKHFAGIGVEFATREHQLAIDRVTPGSPASKAGLSPGLLIRRINGSATAGKSPEQCDDLTRGRAGSAVKLEMIDVAHHKTNSVQLVRELVP